MNFGRKIVLASLVPYTLLGAWFRSEAGHFGWGFYPYVLWLYSIPLIGLLGAVDCLVALAKRGSDSMGVLSFQAIFWAWWLFVFYGLGISRMF